jgi:transcriptional regulator with XRE-family HTH domain
MLGMTVKQLRALRGLTQAALAQRAKVSQAFIAQLETGVEDNPTLITLRRLAKALKVTVGELVD